jgi:Tfp pilus assembly protein PilZ
MMNEASHAVAAAAGVPTVLQLKFLEAGALYAAYMPILANGGILCPASEGTRSATTSTAAVTAR